MSTQNRRTTYHSGSSNTSSTMRGNKRKVRRKKKRFNYRLLYTLLIAFNLILSSSVWGITKLYVAKADKVEKSISNIGSEVSDINKTTIELDSKMQLMEKELKSIEPLIQIGRPIKTEGN